MLLVYLLLTNLFYFCATRFRVVGRWVPEPHYESLRAFNYFVWSSLALMSLTFGDVELSFEWIPRVVTSVFNTSFGNFGMVFDDGTLACDANEALVMSGFSAGTAGIFASASLDSTKMSSMIITQVDVVNFITYGMAFNYVYELHFHQPDTMHTLHHVLTLLTQCCGYVGEVYRCDVFVRAALVSYAALTSSIFSSLRHLVQRHAYQYSGIATRIYKLSYLVSKLAALAEHYRLVTPLVGAWLREDTLASLHLFAGIRRACAPFIKIELGGVMGAKGRVLDDNCDPFSYYTVFTLAIFSLVHAVQIYFCYKILTKTLFCVLGSITRIIRDVFNERSSLMDSGSGIKKKTATRRTMKTY